MENNPIVKEVLIDAPASKVWTAITDRDQMKQWYFDIAEFRPEVGFKFGFTAGDGNKMYRHLCRITEVVPGKKLSYTWGYEDEPGIETHVTFELFEEDGKTRVRLTHEGLEQFPASRPEYARKNFEAGWDSIIGTSLKKFAEQ